MKKTYIILFLISILASGITKAQKVGIGETCPNIKLNTILNYSSKTANLLTAFNDKPLIIDFWFIHCPPCIEFIPKLDSLRKMYNNQFNVLLVTHEKEADIKKFFSENEQFKDNKSPIVYAADYKSTFRLLFPHTSEPHEVWIDKNGVVKAITSAKDVTPENIERFLRGEALHLEEKLPPHDPKYANKPLLQTDEDMYSGKLKLYYSWLGAFDPRQPAMTSEVIDTQKKERKIVATNVSVERLYRIAYEMFRTKDQKEGLLDLRMILQTSDSLKLEADYDAKPRKNIFCYELYMRDTSESKIRNLMQKDLDNFFHLRSSIKQQQTRCYVLSRMANSNNKFIPQDSKEKFVKNKGDSISIKNEKIYSFTRGLSQKLSHPVINKTGYDGNVELTIPKTYNAEQLKKILNQYGLDISPGLTEENILVLQDAEE